MFSSFNQAKAASSRQPSAEIEKQTSLDASQSSQDRRPGKFADLGLFFAEEPQSALVYHSCAGTSRRLGDIIHVHASDPSHELHDRVMIVMRLRGASMTCLTFCRHDGERLPHGHFSVVSEPIATSSPPLISALPDTTYATLSHGSLSAGVLLNLDEPYTLQKDKHNVAVLGYVDSPDFKRLADRAGELYRLGMEEERHHDERAGYHVGTVTLDSHAVQDEPVSVTRNDSHSRHSKRRSSEQKHGYILQSRRKKG